MTASYCYFSNAPTFLFPRNALVKFWGIIRWTIHNISLILNAYIGNSLNMSMGPKEGRAIVFLTFGFDKSRYTPFGDQTILPSSSSSKAWKSSKLAYHVYLLRPPNSSIVTIYKKNCKELENIVLPRINCIYKE